MAVKKKNVMSMEEEDRIFFENAMKDPEIRKKIEAEKEALKKAPNLPDKQTKKALRKK